MSLLLQALLRKLFIRWFWRRLLGHAQQECKLCIGMTINAIIYWVTCDGGQLAKIKRMRSEMAFLDADLSYRRVMHSAYLILIPPELGMLRSADI